MDRSTTPFIEAVRTHRWVNYVSANIWTLYHNGCFNEGRKPDGRELTIKEVYELPDYMMMWERCGPETRALIREISRPTQEERAAAWGIPEKNKRIAELESKLQKCKEVIAYWDSKCVEYIEASDAAEYWKARFAETLLLATEKGLLCDSKDGLIGRLADDVKELNEAIDSKDTLINSLEDELKEWKEAGEYWEERAIYFRDEATKFSEFFTKMRTFFQTTCDKAIEALEHKKE